jgi:hypothetical protein
MPPADLLTVLRHRPFVPFRLVCTDGMSYQIAHPELVMVSLGSAIIGYPSPDLPGAILRHDLVALRSVVRIEYQEVTTT